MAPVARGRTGGVEGALEAAHHVRKLGLRRAGLLDRHRDGDGRECARCADAAAERATVTARARARAIEAESQTVGESNSHGNALIAG